MRFLRLLLVAAVVAVALAGCGDPVPSNPGPLALNDDDGFGAAAFQGTLRISEDCTFLRSRAGNDLALSWPADRTTWDNGRIRFERLDGTVVTLVDGDAVEFGGAGDSLTEGGRTNEEWANHGGWVVAPDSSCARETRIAIGDVEKQEPAPVRIRRFARRGARANPGRAEPHGARGPRGGGPAPGAEDRASMRRPT